MNTIHTAWVEVDLNAIRHNYRAVREFASVPVMAVLKTNAYGHGLELAAGALKGEADWFGVSTLEEGIRVRAVDPDTPTLVFHPVGAWNAAGIVERGLTASVDSEAGALALAEAGRAAGVTPAAHLKIDAGMARFGVDPGDEETISRIVSAPGIRWDGMYTHLATSAEKKPGLKGDLCRTQFLVMARLVSTMATDPSAVASVANAPSWLGPLAEAGPRWIHAFNSAGILRFREDIRHYSLVRCGTLLYGQYPSAYVPKALDLRPTWSYKARIVSIRRIRAGATVGYGAEWRARRESSIATIPVGYYDGFTVEPLSVWARRGGLKGLAKRLMGKDRLTVKTALGPAPVVGRVAAQSAMLDVTDLPGIQVGDVVEMPARRVLVGEHIPRVAQTCERVDI
ncbi:MAG TPA: alanine racemase [Armatimonadota bacterium]|jgi:alanine racemase